jgi:hypothetical protein
MYEMRARLGPLSWRFSRCNVIEKRTNHRMFLTEISTSEEIYFFSFLLYQFG